LGGLRGRGRGHGCGCGRRLRGRRARGELHPTATTGMAPAPVLPGDRLDTGPLQTVAVAAADPLLLALAPVLTYLVDRLVERAHVLQQHQRPGAVCLDRCTHPAHHADLRQRTRYEALLAQCGTA